MIGIKVSSSSKKPIYQQLFEQISSLIIKGDLPTNFNLPSIRTAAKELRISIITVKKAWEELEQAGLIYTVLGKGCFVSKLTERELNTKRSFQIDTRLKKDIEFYKNLGVEQEEMIKLIQKLYNG